MQGGTSGRDVDVEMRLLVVEAGLGEKEGA
jgi:hypothetical protein